MNYFKQFSAIDCSSSSIIDVLSTRSQTTPGAALAYFYLDFNDNKGSKVETLLRSIIAQLFTQKAETSNILDELFDRNQDGASQPTQKELFIAFSCMVREFSTVYVVIDALDECSEQNDMLQMLRDIQQWRVENLHILVTSRQLPEIENYLSDLATDGLSLHGTDLDRDISLYIRERLKEDQTLARWPSEIQEQIWITLSQEARGM